MKDNNHMKHSLNRTTVILLAIAVIVLVAIAGLKIRTQIVVNDMKDEITKASQYLESDGDLNFQIRGEPGCIDACLSVRTEINSDSISITEIVSLLKESDYSINDQDLEEESIQLGTPSCELRIALKQDGTVILNCIHEKFVGF